MKSKFLKSAQDRTTTLSIEITDITPEQADEFRRMFAWMNVLGGWGCSRDFKVGYDGDGGARATIKENGKDLRPEKDEQEKEDKKNFEELRFSFE